MTDMIISLDHYLDEVKRQAFAMHCAAAQRDLEAVRKYFAKFEALQNADKERERQLQQQKIMHVERQNAAAGYHMREEESVRTED